MPDMHRHLRLLHQPVAGTPSVTDGEGDGVPAVDFPGRATLGWIAPSRRGRPDGRAIRSLILESEFVGPVMERVLRDYGFCGESVSQTGVGKELRDTSDQQYFQLFHGWIEYRWS